MPNSEVLIPIFLLLLGYLFYRNKSEINDEKLGEESIDVVVSRMRQSKSQYVVIIRTNDKIYKAFENDKLGAVGYHIYKKYAPAIDQLHIYIIDNFENRIMKIEKDTKSECMIGVDHPDHGHIGYLTILEVNKIS